MKVNLLRVKEYGEVAEIRQDIVHVDGLTNCMNGQIINMVDSTKGVVVGFNQDHVLALVVKGADRIKPGDRVLSTIESFTVPVGRGFLGRRVDALTEPVDGKEPIVSEKRYPLFGAAPAVLERVPVRDVLQTGIKIIDMMIPLGKGQRELLIGDRVTGKTTITTDIVLNQKGKNVICIYCCVGKAEASLAKVVELFEDTGAMEYSIVVSATASHSMGLQYLAPYVATSLGEYFMYEQGKDVLVIFDDLTKHAWIYRQMSLLLERSPGRDAYPGDIFYLHSQLVERAGKLKPERGGGSMTFLPIVETLQGDVARYIPSNLISMTDGQIYTSAPLFSEGFKPAIDLGLSVSRIGNKVQWPAMKALSGMLRLEFVRYTELVKLTRIKAGVSEDVERRLNKGRVVAEILKQDKASPVPMEEQVIILYALAKGFLERVAPADVANYQKSLMAHIVAHRPELLRLLVEKRDLTKEIREGLDEQLRLFASVPL
jgi:F-type H+-transporting ATPase subunit alpha